MALNHMSDVGPPVHGVGIDPRVSSLGRLRGAKEAFMVIHVTPEIEADIRQRIESGEYADESEVVRKALRTLQASEERIREIRTSIERGMAEIERGGGYEWTPELMEEIRREADEMIRLGRLPKPDVCP